MGTEVVLKTIVIEESKTRPDSMVFCRKERDWSLQPAINILNPNSVRVNIVFEITNL